MVRFDRRFSVSFLSHVTTALVYENATYTSVEAAAFIAQLELFRSFVSAPCLAVATQLLCLQVRLLCIAISTWGRTFLCLLSLLLMRLSHSYRDHLCFFTGVSSVLFAQLYCD